MKLVDSRHSLGSEGEKIACDLLVRKGYRILHRNFRYRRAEIDIIALRDEKIVFVEVKSRSSKWIENLGELVRPKQRKLLVQAADHYLVTKAITYEARFDIITIFKSGSTLEIQHLEDAFYHF